ncbi:MAG: ribosome maturation factor RimP [Candidatus Hydrogenedentes bacterium]|nr:ribosome maturation factor RimP [Candidatus Hydrogenedentota bacterium]MBI3117039.1 ribosome maturation factor RimP [Candidatus Hydrogenedentota bacterium]
MESGERIQRIWQELEPILREQGFELVEVELARQGGTPLLRLFIDRPAGGITLDDCTLASRVLSPVLDTLDVMEDHYLLEVSSPGIARPLRKVVDFQRFMGEEIKAEAFTPVEGRKKFTGILRSIEEGLITVECAGTPYRIHIDNLKKAHLNR